MSKEIIPRVYVFIDAANLWAIQKSKGRLIDLEKLKSFLRKEFEPCELTMFYYDAFPKQGTRETDLAGKKHKFYTYLKKSLEVIVRKKPLKRILITSENGESHYDEKGNMDVEMAIDIVRNIDKYDIGVVLSGDSDFLELLNYMRREGKKSYVFSSKNNVSTELRTGSDGYTDLLTVGSIWGTDLVRRENRKRN